MMKKATRLCGLAVVLMALAVGQAQATLTTLYWTQFDGSGNGSIVSANANGSGVNTSFITGQTYVKQVAFNSANQRLYFGGQFGIRSSKLDGTDVQYVRSWNDGYPGGLSVDPDASLLYWAREGDQAIYRGDFLNNAATTLISGRTGPLGTALDTANGKIYWTQSNSGNGGIYRANLDGSGIQTLIGSGQGWIKGIALDLAMGQMYWSYNGGIRRANLDGSGIQQVVADGSDSWDVTLDLVNTNAYYFSGSGQNASLKEIFNFRSLTPTVSTIVAGNNTWWTSLEVVTIPEPSIAFLLGAGGLLLAWWRKRH